MNKEYYIEKLIGELENFLTCQSEKINSIINRAYNAGYKDCKLNKNSPVEIKGKDFTFPPKSCYLSDNIHAEMVPPYLILTFQSNEDGFRVVHTKLDLDVMMDLFKFLGLDLKSNEFLLRKAFNE